MGAKGVLHTDGINTVADKNFELVKEYINTGKSGTLTEETQRILDNCVIAYGLLKQYPLRNIAIKRFMALTKLTYKCAAKYIDFARHTWGSYIDVSKEFLQNYFLNQLLTEISNPNTDPAIRAKDLATLQKHLASMPDEKIDPKLMEQNTIVIQFNIGEGKSIQFTQDILNALPANVRETITAQISNAEISETEAQEILES